MPEQLEIFAHGVTAILATWLGLTVLTRGGRQPGARIFAVLTAYLVVWSVSIIAQRLTANPEVVSRPLNAIEDLAAYLLPVGTLHIALALTVEGRRSTPQNVVLTSLYGISVAMASGAVLFPEHQFAVTAPRTLHFLPGPADTDPWLGVSLVGLAMILAAYAVFTQGVFLSHDVAARAFRYSVVVGLALTLYVAALAGLERWTSDVLVIELPIVTALAIVVTLALFEPVAGWARRTIQGRSERETAYDRLLRALGQDVLTAQRPEAVVEPALARLRRTFKLTGAVVRGMSGATVARQGDAIPDSPLALRLPLQSGTGELGSVIFGPKRSLLPFTPQEVELLTVAAGFLAASLSLGERHEVQVDALASLSAERAAVHERGRVLSDALVQAASREEGLHVFALGPLRVARAGTAIRQWGGAKAGTRQAEALFAFLFDRGERGVAKDEIIELIWPDVDLPKADLAFHRTLGGLRTTLQPGRRGGDRGAAIAFHNDRYRLDASLVDWSDVAAFDQEMAAASAAPEETALRHMERARALYRGDYLDDCPFYGDSAQVEVGRELLRGRFVDLLMALGERYERAGDRPAAAASFRQARSVAGDGWVPATDALARLAASV
ncbi:MAG: hypothetical protein LC798_08100 [Chloroflexi bacterium]|nr:hypothetical protein [Chloroflexota bacterium]